MVAKPTDSVIYNAEKGRLSEQVLRHLEKLKYNPTKEGLVSFESVLRTTLRMSLNRVASDAYVLGAKAVDRKPDSVKGIALQRAIYDRADQAAIWITDTSGAALNINAMSIKRVASPARADLIAVNNLAVAFFRGTRFGWGLNEDSLKSWFVSDVHDKDDTCDDNEDEGPIPIEEPFQSGDFEPPAHVSCGCDMRLSRRRRREWSY